MSLSRYRYFTSATIFVLGLQGCGNAPRQDTDSDLHIDKTIPSSSVNHVEVVKFVKEMHQIVSAETGGFAISRLFTMMKTTDEERDTLNKARPVETAIDCDDGKCLGKNEGQQIEIVLSKVDIPVIGVPSFKFDKNIEMRFRMVDEGTLEFCKISGLMMKLGRFYAPLDGVLIKSNGTTASVLLTARVWGTSKVSSYPTDDCE